MYKVLLVDDEELDLEGMKRFIPWSELGMEVKGSVNNALSACEIIDGHPSVLMSEPFNSIDYAKLGEGSILTVMDSTGKNYFCIGEKCGRAIRLFHTGKDRQRVNRLVAGLFCDG
ncbi:response regulator [Paenibacillus sp. FJAT-27812]|uniref:response regulator n=1 Tax=Paenibacillus sp. FJAT-27812 TaxID=1684143 RepID=UPI0006A790DA|nr:response regulator [Paenibacillus sp. FJAT-27812]